MYQAQYLEKEKLNSIGSLSYPLTFLILFEVGKKLSWTPFLFFIVLQT